ncbi:AraC family transcriptional regulator [Clostridium sp. C8-1-8]|uniref:AraC family transcriptional regulator n=1 Tax=Clostridium sp. C8-1-8 TaxID=2698831 RepID=UPI00136EB601|nr:AraC family transcriptional regulator [Clostridium sp. C8-1-8]
MKSIYKKIEDTMAKNRYASYIHPPYELESKLVQCIQQLDGETAIYILQKINSLERAQLSKQPLTSLKYSIVGSCAIFTRAAIEVGLDTETAFILSDYYINLIDETSNVNALQELEYSMLNDFINVSKRYKQYFYNPLINRVIEYIKKNIENPLSLQEISTFAKVHPNYLSAAFKKEVGKTLSGYISEVKIAAIKLYLNNTDLSVTEISHIFNFNHITYFSRFFKKHIGLTPMEYRKQILTATV